MSQEYEDSIRSGPFGSQSEPLVSIIILTYNGVSLLKTFLPSVLETEYSNLEFIIVDDGSTDSTLEVLKEFSLSCKNIKVVSHGRNMGIAYARNTGFRTSKGEFIAFLDNDMLVDKDWLRGLVGAIGADENVGVAMSLTFDFILRDRLQCAGQRIFALNGLTVSVGYGQHIHELDLIGEDVFACLNAALVRRTVFEKIGGIDTAMTYLWEDIDFEWRVWASGYREIIVPNSKVYHLAKSGRRRKSTYKWSRSQSDFIGQGVLPFMVKNYQLKTLLFLLPFAIIFLLARSLLRLAVDNDASLLLGMISQVKELLSHREGVIISRRKTQRVRRFSDKEIISRVGFTDVISFIRYHRVSQMAAREFTPQVEN